MTSSDPICSLCARARRCWRRPSATSRPRAPRRARSRPRSESCKARTGASWPICARRARGAWSRRGARGARRALAPRRSQDGGHARRRPARRSPGRAGEPDGLSLRARGDDQRVSPRRRHADRGVAEVRNAESRRQTCAIRRSPGSSCAWRTTAAGCNGEAEAGMGLAGMRDRVRLMGGSVSIASPQSGGVVVEARFTTARATYDSGKFPGDRRNSARENI